jgi:diguanylate cyclase (GGDEF)-like protein
MRRKLNYLRGNAMGSDVSAEERATVMTDSTQFLKKSLPLKHSAFILVVVWTAAIAFGAGWHMWKDYQDMLELARIQASNSFEKDLVYRRWVAGHGGVYVPPTEETPPNPYLAHLKDRDVTTTSGLELTLVNPAYMTRQVHELGHEQYGHQGHITSLNPIRPENAPDAWEADALQALERGETEVVRRARIEGTEYMRLMRPLITEAGCLKCHAAQGYKVGDQRGGISVSVPMALLRTTTNHQITTVTMGYGLIWLLGLGGIGLATSRMGQRIRERDQAEEERERLLRDTRERVKELHGLYGVAKAVTESMNLEDLFKRTSVLIPPAWQYPEITRGRVIFDGQTYDSEPFEPTRWIQTADIMVNGKLRGAIEVYYLGERPELQKEQFLAEERDLINGIAGMLGAAIERDRAEEEREKLLHEVEKLSITDHLTGLNNRRSFDVAASRNVKAAIRYNRPVSAMMLDIDLFKRVNDAYGHAVGDKVLVGIAHICQKNTRSSDLVARYGGEEFCFLLSETDAQSARRLAENLRIAISALYFEFGGQRFNVTVSIGIAECAGEEDSLESLLGRSDVALYRAKEAGRNCVMQ